MRLQLQIQKSLGAVKVLTKHGSELSGEASYSKRSKTKHHVNFGSSHPIKTKHHVKIYM